MEHQRKLKTYFGSALLSLLPIHSAFALDPNLPPAGNFDLSGWKLTLPISENSYFGSGSDDDAAEIESGRDDDGSTCTDGDDSLLPLDEGFYDSTYFYTGSDGAMVFNVPLVDETSSTYIRSELREMYNWSPCDDIDNVNWELDANTTHRLSATLRVTDYYEDDSQTVVGQIHATDSSYALLKMQWDGPGDDVRALLTQNATSGGSTYIAFDEIIPGTDDWSYDISIQYDTLTISVSYNGITQTETVIIGSSTDEYGLDENWLTENFYFKAGNYAQTDKTNDGQFTVEFTELSVSH